MSLKIILSDEEYTIIIKKWVKASFEATDFFDKYEEILPIDILSKAYDKRVNIYKSYSKLLDHSIKISDIK